MQLEFQLNSQADGLSQASILPRSVKWTATFTNSLRMWCSRSCSALAGKQRGGGIMLQVLLCPCGFKTWWWRKKLCDPIKHGALPERFEDLKIIKFAIDMLVLLLHYYITYEVAVALSKSVFLNHVQCPLPETTLWRNFMLTIKPDYTVNGLILW